MTLHNRPFPYTIESREYEPAQARLYPVITGGFGKNCDRPVHLALARHLGNHTGRILVALMDQQTDEPIEGGTARCGRSDPPRLRR